jgi:hypothetical protein
MFAKDFDLLNEIYNNRINEMNIGPQGEVHAPVKVTGMPPKKQCLKGNCPVEDEDCEECGGTCGEAMDDDHNEEHENADMAKQSLFRLFKLSAMLHDIIQQGNHVEPWILAKITDAQKSIEAAFSYEDYEQYRSQVDSDMTNIEEETEKDLYASISSGGSNILSLLRKTLATESKKNVEALLYETIVALEARK